MLECQERHAAHI